MKRKMVKQLLAVGLIGIMISTTSIYAANQEGEKLEQEKIIEDGNVEQLENNTEVTNQEETEKEAEKVAEEPEKEDTNGTQTINKDDCTPVQGLEEPYEIAELEISARGIGTWIQSTNGRWWYLHHDGGYTINGWENIGGAWYYFDSNGWMMTGWINTGSWYYLSTSGAMVTGWQNIDGTWYYFDGNGGMMTGWVNTGSWYYLSTNGAMVTGWQSIGGAWYYFDSNGWMMIGWINTGSWYYLSTNGAMVTDWQNIDGSWYYLGINGAMQSGWVNTGSWYYLYSNGIMATGWLSLGAKTYYMGSDGAMRSGNQTVNGTQYYFVESGERGAQRSKMSSKHYYFTDFNGTRVGATVKMELTEDVCPESYSTSVFVKRTGILTYVSGGTASLNFICNSPRHVDSGNSLIRTFSWDDLPLITPSGTNIVFSKVNRSKIEYSNSNSYKSMFNYVLSSDPGVESGGVRLDAVFISLFN